MTLPLLVDTDGVDIDIKFSTHARIMQIVLIDDRLEASTGVHLPVLVTFGYAGAHGDLAGNTVSPRHSQNLSLQPQCTWY